MDTGDTIFGKKQFFPSDLEQVHVRGINRRSLRLKLVAGLATALALPLFTAAASAQGVTTSTAIAVQNGQSSAQTNPAGTCSLTTVAVSVTSSQGTPAGTVTLKDTATTTPVTLGSQTINGTGQASFSLALANGTHTLVATYSGNATYQGSSSVSVSQTISSQCGASFAVTVSGMSPSNTLTAGQQGTATVTVTPLPSFLASLGSAPAFITVSCSGLPNQASCVFSPEDLEILPGQSQGVTSTMVLQTEAAGTAGKAAPGTRPGRPSAPVAWAVLLPGILGLGGLAWGARRRSWLNKLALIALVALVATLGTTGCNPHYYYYNHGPPTNPATPAGSYNVTVTGQSSNGITAITQNTSFALTVQ
jgi:hypothetical protein